MNSFKNEYKSDLHINIVAYFGKAGLVVGPSILC